MCFFDFMTWFCKREPEVQNALFPLGRLSFCGNAHGKVEGNATKSVKAIGTHISTEWAPIDESIGRLKGGWWFGYRITAPEWIDQNTLEQITKIKWINEGEQFKEAFFNDVKDGDRFVDNWVFIDDRDKKKGEKIGEKVVFIDWLGDGRLLQKFTLSVVKTDFIELKGGENE